MCHQFTTRPADVERVREFLLKAIELKVGQAEPLGAADRKRLKSIMADMQLPSSMGCIVRTAGLQRTKVEIKRDFDYLARLWDGIREATLGSSAPALI